jgi:hypothetical protein
MYRYLMCVCVCAERVKRNPQILTTNRVSPPSPDNVLTLWSMAEWLVISAVVYMPYLLVMGTVNGEKILDKHVL